MSDLYTAAEESLYLSEHRLSTPPPEELPGQNCLIVQLAAGQLVLLGNFNYFRLDGADRQLIETILDAVDTHTETNLPIPEFLKTPGTANEDQKSEEPTPEVKQNV